MFGFWLSSLCNAVEICVAALQLGLGQVWFADVGCPAFVLSLACKLQHEMMCQLNQCLLAKYSIRANLVQSTFGPFEEKNPLRG